MFLSQNRQQRVYRNNAILKRDRDGIRTDHRFGSGRRFFGGPKLHGDDNYVDRADDFSIAGCLDVCQMDVPKLAEDLQSFLLQRFKVCAPGDKGNVLSTSRQAGAKIAADASAAHDRNLHVYSFPYDCVMVKGPTW